MTTSTHNLLSPAEHKILVGIGFLLLILMIGSIVSKCIESYNYQVEQEQKLKRGNDNKSGGIEFTGSNCGSRGPTFYEAILHLQFFWIPLIIFNLWKRKNFKFSNFLTAFCLSAINIFCYLCWIYGSYIGRVQNEVFGYGADSLHTYLMIDSNIFDFSTFLGFVILFIAQTVFLLRFALEKDSRQPMK